MSNLIGINGQPLNSKQAEGMRPANKSEMEVLHLIHGLQNALKGGDEAVAAAIHDIGNAGWLMRVGDGIKAARVVVSIGTHFEKTIKGMGTTTERMITLGEDFAAGLKLACERRDAAVLAAEQPPKADSVTS